MIRTQKSLGKLTIAVLVTAFLAVAIAACGGSSSGSTGTGSSGGGGSSSATVTTAKVSGYGTALSNSSGKPLFMLTADSKTASKCNGSCAKTWVPLTVSGKPSAGSGVSGSMLSTIKRSDGSEQVTYNGHPLYTFTGPASSGAGMAGDGGVWYLVAPSGDPIKHTQSGTY